MTARWHPRCTANHGAAPRRVPRRARGLLLAEGSRLYAAVRVAPRVRERPGVRQRWLLRIARCRRPLPRKAPRCCRIARRRAAAASRRGPVRRAVHEGHLSGRHLRDRLQRGRRVRERCHVPGRRRVSRRVRRSVVRPPRGVPAREPVHGRVHRRQRVRRRHPVRNLDVQRHVQRHVVVSQADRVHERVRVRRRVHRRDVVPERVDVPARPGLRVRSRLHVDVARLRPLLGHPSSLRCSGIAVYAARHAGSVRPVSLRSTSALPRAATRFARSSAPAARSTSTQYA